MKIFTIISRLLVGSLFIVSGLIKANDPVGFSYKLKDYFAADVLNMEWLVPFALVLAVVICIVEIVLGFATVMGSKMKPVSWLLLLMIIFFTFLTFYSAYFEKVTDCGCFGDALKLTPWQSFSKDAVLLVFVLVIFLRRKAIELNSSKEDMIYGISSLALISIFSVGVLHNPWPFPIWFTGTILAIILILKKIKPLSTKTDQVVFVIPALLSIIFSAYVLMHLPIKDFRPYAEGKSIIEGMKDCEELTDKECPEYMVLYKMKSTENGETKTVDSKEYLEKKLWEDKTWEILPDETENILINEGYEPPIHDFSITSSEEGEVTFKYLEDPNYTLIIIAYNINNENNIEVKDKVNALAKGATGAGVSFIGLSASSDEDVDIFRHEVQAMYAYFATDEKTLQTIIRSNPGLLLLKAGTVIKKWHYNDLPKFDEIDVLKRTNG
ncbi:MAG TPA: DoxX family protein [Flavobacteriales bacterium]|nr:DoxX family protein [Flavobacteriales bacterium]